MMRFWVFLVCIWSWTLFLANGFTDPTDASLQMQHDLGWMKKLHYILHPTLGLRTTIFALQIFVDGETWQKVVYIDRLLQLFKYIPREQLTIPDSVFQHDLEVNGGKGFIVDPRTKYIYQRPSA